MFLMRSLVLPLLLGFAAVGLLYTGYLSRSPQPAFAATEKPVPCCAFKITFGNKRRVSGVNWSGGIRDAEKAYLNCKAGADVIVIGNAIEKNPSLVKEMAAAIHQPFAFT